MEKYWNILGITPARDLDTLKNAYREKLVLTNPEDDPEGFKALRNAYEEAVKWAKSEEPLVQKTEPEPLEEWIKQIEEVYSSFPKRISKEYWMELLNHEVCIGLDTVDSAREKLLEFLTSHFRLPYDIWKLLEQYFHFTEDKKELYERYPKYFIDYVLNNIAYPGMIDYQLFEGEEDGDYDEFMNQIFQIRNTIDRGKEFPTESFDKLESLEIYHPYSDIERVRYLISQKEWKEAKGIMDKLTPKYPENLYILFHEAKVDWGLEHYEKAYQIYTKILDRDPNYYGAKLGIADYYQHTGKYWDAKELYVELLENDGRNLFLTEHMRSVNEVLIKEFGKKLKDDPEDMTVALELSWCFFQNEKYQEVIQTLDWFRPDGEHYFDYHNLKGRTYLVLEEYKKALAHLEKWLEEIKKLKEDGTVKTRKRIRRLGYAYYTQFIIYSSLPDEEGENKKKALEFLEKAIEAETALDSRMVYLHAKANAFFQMKEYQKSVDVCNDIIEINNNYYPAYITRQEAYYQLEYYKNVIEDYYRAVDIYPHHIVPYMWAIRTYWLYRDYESGIKVIERAKEYKLHSNEMVLYEIRFLRNLAKTKEDTKKVLDLCLKLKELIKDDNNDLNEQSEVFFESSLCFMDSNQFEEAITEINKAIASDSSRNDYYFAKGNIYSKLEKYEEAIGIYKALCREQPDNGVILFRLGQAYHKKGDTEKAITLYEKVLILIPEHDSANHELMEIYEDRWKETEKLEFYEKAVFYAGKQLEITPNDYFYIERGLLYLSHNAFKEAEADFLKAASINPDNLYAYNNTGMTYRNRRQFEEAIFWFEKAVEKMDFDESLLPYANMGACYKALGQYEKAIQCYKKNVELFPKKASAYASLAEAYRRAKRFPEALDYLLKGSETSDANEIYFLLHIGDIHLEQGQPGKALNCYKEALKPLIYIDVAAISKKDSKSKGAYKGMGDYYYYIAGKYKKALKYYMDGLKALEEKEDQKDTYKESPPHVRSAENYDIFCVSIGRVWKDLKKEDKARQYFAKALESYKTAYGSIDAYLSYEGYQLVRHYKICRLYCYLGDLEKAREYVSKMKTFRMCNECTYRECYEMLEVEAILYEAEGDMLKAMECYTKVIEIYNNHEFAVKRLKELKKTNK